MQMNLPHVWMRSFRTGAAAYYRRNRGAYVVRIRAADGTPLLPGQAGFLDAYNRLHAAFEVRPQPTRHARLEYSVSALIASFTADDTWLERSPVTRSAYTRRCAVLADVIGDADARALTRHDVKLLRGALAENPDGSRSPSRANEAMRMLSLLMEHAVDLGWRRAGDNPAKGVKALRTGEGHQAWSSADVAAALAHKRIPEPVKRAIALGYYTGLRRTDCITLPKSARKDGVIFCRPQKTAHSTGAEVRVIEHPELTRRLDAAPKTDAPTLLTNGHGQPWDGRRLGEAIAAAAVLIGRPGLTLHGLRKGLTSALAESGATDAEIEAVVPHASRDLTRYYRRQADQTRLAEAAIAKMTTGEKPR